MYLTFFCKIGALYYKLSKKTEIVKIKILELDYLSN